MKKIWRGTPPTKCDICGRALTDTFIDGKTAFGPWAMMCTGCHTDQGGKLGTGLGQKYTLDKTSPGPWTWVKVGG
jgi:hypothetical protein